MYYIEPKESDSIELQESLSESQVINRARNFDDSINTLQQALQVLNKNGYIVFEDC